MFGPLDHPVGDSSLRGAAQRTGVCRPIYGLCIGVQAGLGPCRPGSSRLASLLDIFPWWCGGEVMLCGYMVWYLNSVHPAPYLVLQGVAQIADFSFLTLLQ